MTQNIKPVESFRDGAVQAAVFEREVEGPKGNFTSKSVALQIGYKDKDGNWQNQKISIIKRNLDKITNVLNQASEYLTEEVGASSAELKDDSIGFSEGVM